MNLAAYVAVLLLWGAMHALWQGALVALLVSPRRGSPASRYRSALSGLAVILLAFVIDIATAHLALRENATLGALGALVSELPAPIASMPGPLDYALGAAGTFAIVWLSGVAFGVAGLVLSAWRIASIRRASLPAPPALRRTVRTLGEKMGLAVMPNAVVSNVARVPFVAGRMPGLLVIPAAAAHDNELEALILHELAHLRRRDCETNMLLRAMHLILWFHPAAWLLHTRAAIAREEACDVDALSHTNAIVLARALVGLEVQRHALAGAMRASDGSLATRVRTLIAGGYRDHRPASWVPALGMMLVFAAGAATSARLSPASDVLAIAGARANVVERHTVDITAADPAGRFSIALLNGRVAGATVAGVPIMRSAIRRRADHVTLLDAHGASVVAVQLDPRGSIHWMPRDRSGVTSSSP
ncbi:MAG: M56 family metallopeptidase [Gemmatimonadaceae bacterium]